ncbi:MAG: thioredoxin-disulfide reductase [bacterium]
MSNYIDEDWELLIIGGGPAGLSSGLYATRSGLKTLLVEGSCIGGQAIKTDRIENYPGFPDAIKGSELLENMRRQSEGFGLKIEEFKKVKSLEIEDVFNVNMENGSRIRTKAIILSTGAEYRDLEVPGAERLKGRGISYCATCDAPFFKDKPILVVGGGNAAIEEAIYLTRFASKVYVAHRRDRLRADKVLQDKAFGEAKIEMLWNTIVHEIVGSEKVEKAVMEDVKTKRLTEIDVSGIFVYIGTKPNTDFIKGIVDLDEHGYIITDSDMVTSCPGIFAAGDCRHKRLRQIATAVGEGAAAAVMAYDYIQDIKGVGYPSNIDLITKKN